jgi:putative aldouronate transport system substrate-binding protein
VDAFRKGLIVPARVVNEPYFEDLLNFLDWAIYSDEGMTLTTWGIEGLTYENTESGKNFLPEIISPKNPAGTVNIAAEYGLDLLFNLNENQEFEDYKKPDEIVAFLERSLQANETLELAPKLILDPASLDAIKIINEKLDPYVSETGTAFITGERSIENEWDTYIEELEKRGNIALESIWNDTWDRQNNSD